MTVAFAWDAGVVMSLESSLVYSIPQMLESEFDGKIRKSFMRDCSRCVGGRSVVAGVGDFRRALLGLWGQGLGVSIFFAPRPQRRGRRAGRRRGAGGSAELALGFIPEFLVAPGGAAALFPEVIGTLSDGTRSRRGGGVHDDSIVFTGPFRDNSTTTPDLATRIFMAAYN